MKRKRVVIGLGVVIVLLVFGGFGLYHVVRGPEKLSGPLAAIPRPIAAPQPIRAGQADWPCWRGLDSDGKSSVTGIRTDWSGGLKKLWEVNFLCQGLRTATWSAPVVRGNRLVIPGRDEQRDLVFCLDPDTGDLIWAQSYEAPILVPKHGPGARATPYLDDERVYTFGYRGDLACWQLADGKPLWKCRVEDAGGEMPTWGHSSSPFVYEDKVFVQGGGKALVVAYDKMTGRLLWKALEGKAGYAAITPLCADGTLKLLVFHGTGLACLDPSDGAVLWQVPWKTSFDASATTPIVAGQTVFLTSGYGAGGQALRISDGKAEPLWRNRRDRVAPFRPCPHQGLSLRLLRPERSEPRRFQVRRAGDRDREVEHGRDRLGHVRPGRRTSALPGHQGQSLPRSARAERVHQGHGDERGPGRGRQPRLDCPDCRQRQALSPPHATADLLRSDQQIDTSCRQPSLTRLAEPEYHRLSPQPYLTQVLCALGFLGG